MPTGWASALDAPLDTLRAGDEQPVDWSLVIKLLGRALARAEQEMVRTDAAHEAERAYAPENARIVGVRAGRDACPRYDKDLSRLTAPRRK